MRQYFARETKRGYAPLSLYTTAARTYPCKERNRAAFIHVYLQYVSVIRFEPVQKLTSIVYEKNKKNEIWKNIYSSFHSILSKKQQFFQTVLP